MHKGAPSNSGRLLRFSTYTLIMLEYPALLRHVLAGEHLAPEQADMLFAALMDGDLSPVRASALLAALAAKGEHPGEIAAAANAMRERSVRVPHSSPMVVDIVGTGGDGANTINISTMAALVVAACGIPVAKHGNRAASSACGSADVLEGAGLGLEIDPKIAARQLEEAGFCFLFAPRYHPAMRHVAPIRRELGVRTVFNILGPLTNPARATHQIVGVARLELLEPVARVLGHLGVQSGAVVHARNGIDEIAGDVETDVVSFSSEKMQRWSIDPKEFGIDVGLDALRASDVPSCVAVFTTILGGGRHPGSEVVALNAALGLLVADHVSSLRDGVELARRTLASGSALRCFQRVKSIGNA